MSAGRRVRPSCDRDARRRVSDSHGPRAGASRRGAHRSRIGSPTFRGRSMQPRNDWSRWERCGAHRRTPRATRALPLAKRAQSRKIEARTGLALGTVRCTPFTACARGTSARGGEGLRRPTYAGEDDDVLIAISPEIENPHDSTSGSVARLSTVLYSRARSAGLPSEKCVMWSGGLRRVPSACSDSSPRRRSCDDCADQRTFHHSQPWSSYGRAPVIIGDGELVAR